MHQPRHAGIASAHARLTALPGRNGPLPILCTEDRSRGEPPMAETPTFGRYARFPDDAE